MAGGPDNKQLDLEFGRELDNVAQRMAREQVGMKLHLAFFGHGTCALKDGAVATGSRPRLLSNFLDEFRQIRNLLD
jgi:hypothetical protein